MIPATSASLPITHPSHPLYHDDCPLCGEHYGKPIPEVTAVAVASDEEVKVAIQKSRWLVPVPSLRKVRDAQYTSRARLSKLSGVNEDHIAKLEHGEHMARKDTARRLAGALHVTVADLEGTA